MPAKLLTAVPSDASAHLLWQTGNFKIHEILTWLNSLLRAFDKTEDPDSEERGNSLILRYFKSGRNFWFALRSRLSHFISQTNSQPCVLQRGDISLSLGLSHSTFIITISSSTAAECCFSRNCGRQVQELEWSGIEGVGKGGKERGGEGG